MWADDRTRKQVVVPGTFCDFHDGPLARTRSSMTACRCLRQYAEWTAGFPQRTGLSLKPPVTRRQVNSLSYCFGCKTLVCGQWKQTPIMGSVVIVFMASPR